MGVVGGGAFPKEWVHNLRMQFVTLGISKMKIFQTYFLDIVTTQHDHPTYLCCVCGDVFVFCTFFGFSVCVCVGGGGEGFQRIGKQPTYALRDPRHFKDPSFGTLVFLYSSHTMTIQPM